VGPQPREDIVSVGGTKIHTMIGGQGPPLLLLHGAGGNPGWRRSIAALAERFTVYVPTHPGFGQSDSADWMETASDLARFYLWFLDEVGLKKVHLGGWSLGGWTAAELAVMNPDVLERVVLVAAVGLKPEQGEILDIFFYPLEQLRGFMVHDPSTVPEWQELYGQAATPEERDLQLRNREMAARLTWKPYMFNPRLPHFLPRVKVPTLIIWGQQDRIVPAICGHQYQRLLPNAELRLLDNCGHQPYLEQPEAFSGLLLDFLGADDRVSSVGRR
jgi:pimeloyl-ACP methyl ester carboxylesterase